MRRGLAVLLVVALIAGAASAATPARPRVTLITDSVGASLGWDAAAARIFSAGLDVDFELRSCRRLTTPGCAVAGETAPENALDTIRRLGPRIGPNVVIDVGYNDAPSVYGPGIEEVLRALAAAHVERVFWVTLKASRGAYAASNALIEAAARRHRDVSVVDWNACSAGHADWFAPDGLHLSAAGAEGLASCMHDAVFRVLNAAAPIEVRLAFPAGITPGIRARLVATGGTAPYRFTVRGLPAGWTATRAGAMRATVLRAGSFVLRVSVTDAHGRTADVRVPLRVA